MTHRRTVDYDYDDSYVTCAVGESRCPENKQKTLTLSTSTNCSTTCISLTILPSQCGTAISTSFNLSLSLSPKVTPVMKQIYIYIKHA